MWSVRGVSDCAEPIRRGRNLQKAVLTIETKDTCPSCYPRRPWPPALVFCLPSSLTTMERYLSTSTSASSDDIILAPYWINPKATDASKNIEEFKLQGKHHLRCKALTKGPKNTKPRSSPIWKWGEDIQLKD